MLCGWVGWGGVGGVGVGVGGKTDGEGSWKRVARGSKRCSAAVPDQRTGQVPPAPSHPTKALLPPPPPCPPPRSPCILACQEEPSRKTLPKGTPRRSPPKRHTQQTHPKGTPEKSWSSVRCSMVCSSPIALSMRDTSLWNSLILQAGVGGYEVRWVRVVGWVGVHIVYSYVFGCLWVGSKVGRSQNACVWCVGVWRGRELGPCPCTTRMKQGNNAKNPHDKEVSSSRPVQQRHHDHQHEGSPNKKRTVGATHLTMRGHCNQVHLSPRRNDNRKQGNDNKRGCSLDLAGRLQPGAVRQLQQVGRQRPPLVARLRLDKHVGLEHLAWIKRKNGGRGC